MGIGGVVRLLSLIQVSPLKLNPWDNIFAWIGKKLNGSTEKRLQEVEKQVSDMWINNHRQCILNLRPRVPLRYQPQLR